MLIRREKLYEEVWAEPMLTVATHYGVSSSFMARICQRLKVPCPPRGYWAKKAAGLKLKIPPLQEPEPGDELGWARGSERVPRQPYPPPSTDAVPKAQIVLPNTPVEGLHPHVVDLEVVLKEAQELSNGYLKSSKRLLADVFVTKGTLSRAIEVASQFYRLLEAQHHRVGFSPSGLYDFQRPDLKYCNGKKGAVSSWDTWTPARPTLVYIGTMPLGITLFELSEEAEAQQRNGKWIRLSEIPPPKGRQSRYAPSYYTSTHDFLTGRLGIRAYSPYTDVPWEHIWVETEPGGLSDMLAEIATSLKTHASKLVPLVHKDLEKKRIEQEKREAEHQAWLEKRAIEEEKERQAAQERARKQAIQDSKDELMELLKRWDQAMRVQAFLAQIEGLVANAPVEEQPLLQDRLEQARAFLGEVDLLALLRRWKTPSEREPLEPRPESAPAAVCPPVQEQTEVQLRNEVDLWRRRYIYGRR